MRKFTAIIESSTPPIDTNAIWLYKGVLNYYSNGKWVRIVTKDTDTPTTVE